MAQPFIKLRKDIDILFPNPDALILYTYLLKEANYKETYFAPGKFNVPAGACVRSRATISKATGLTDNQIRHQIKHLIKIGFITKCQAGKYAVISTDCEFIGTKKQPNVSEKKQPNNQPNKPPHNKNNKEYKDKDILSNDNIKKSEDYGITI